LFIKHYKKLVVNLAIENDILFFMKINFLRLLTLLLVITILAASTSSCAKRDCRGRKKTAKTSMGGWL